jgi:hypothetical protein
LLEAPNGAWADHVEALIHKALGRGGSLTLGFLPEAIWDVTEASACFRTGVAECDAPPELMLANIASSLRDYDVEVRRLDSGGTQIVVRPRPQPARNPFGL